MVFCSSLTGFSSTTTATTASPHTTRIFFITETFYGANQIGRIIAVDQRERITEIFGREIAQAHEDIETTPHIEWIERLREDVLVALD